MIYINDGHINRITRCSRHDSYKVLGCFKRPIHACDGKYIPSILEALQAFEQGQIL